MTANLPGATPKRRARAIREPLQVAIRLMVTEGLTQADAARQAGMTAHGLQIALKKPHVKAFVSHVKDAWFNSRTFKSWLGVAELADNANSEDVRLKAHRTFLEAAGELGNKNPDPAGLARQLVQIVINQGQNLAPLTDGQVSGVVEAPAYQPVRIAPSNSDLVGRAESGDEGDD